jgi:hypothetical protein
MRTRATLAFLIVLVCSLCRTTIGSDENGSARQEARTQQLSFTARPAKSLFRVGEDVVFRFKLKNFSSKRVFVSRYMTVGDFVTIELTGPDGKEVRWQGKIRSIAYSKDAFLVLGPGQEVSANHTISVTKGEGFAIDKPGRYTVLAEYSLGPPEYFSNLAPKESIPQGVFKAVKTHFTVAASTR